MSEVLESYSCTTRDFGCLFDWLGEMEVQLDKLGWYYSVEVLLGCNEMCDWGLDVLERGRLIGNIYIFCSKEDLLKFEVEKSIINN